MTSLLFHFWFYLALIVALVFMLCGFFFVAKGEPLSRFPFRGLVYDDPRERQGAWNSSEIHAKVGHGQPDSTSALVPKDRAKTRAPVHSTNLCANQQKLGCQIFAKVGQYDFTTAKIASRDDFPASDPRAAILAKTHNTHSCCTTPLQLSSKWLNAGVLISNFARPGAHNLSPRDGVRQDGLLWLLLVNKQIT